MKNKLFWKIYGVIFVLAIALSFTFLVVFWNFLTAYEKSQPKHQMEKVINLFQDGNSQELLKYVTYNMSVFENNETVIKYIDSILSDGQWEYVHKTGEYSKDAPVYNVNKDGKTVATAKLAKSSEKGDFKMDQWELQSLDKLLVMQDAYVILAPSNATVYVNGIQLSSEYIIEKDIPIGALSNSAKFVTVPTMVKYSVSGLYAEPEIKATGNVLNTELTATKQGGVLRFAFEENQNFNKSQESRIIEFTQLYGRYVTNDVKFPSVSPYIMGGSNAYSFLKAIALNNVWYGSHSYPTFNNIVISNYQLYAENFFSCDISFTLSFTMAKKSFEYPTDLRYYFVKSNNAWYIADFVIK